MKSDLPNPDEILEELADKTAAEIDRLAPVAFDKCFEEMTDYHRFLIALSSPPGEDAALYSFAEVVGQAWAAPHELWIRRYRRLFERAADRIPDDDLFIRKLAYSPSKLLPGVGDQALPPRMVREILDLELLLVGRLQAWVTKRTVLEAREGQTANQRLVLAGSDARAYQNVLPSLVGAWESILMRAPAMYGWRAESEDKRWAAYQSSWPYLLRHLTNTAYCVAMAVWNQDEAGSAIFREALVRWPENLKHSLGDDPRRINDRLLAPSMLDSDWLTVSRQFAQTERASSPRLSPNQIFSSLVYAAHDDAVLLTSALLLSWNMKEKQATDIGGRTGKALLLRVNENEPDDSGAATPSFLSTILGLLRLEVIGDRTQGGSYAQELDRLVLSMDNLTERSVVPGRVYTPTTVHGFDDLIESELAILLALLPMEGDGNLAEKIASWVQGEQLPGGDDSVRNIRHRLSQFSQLLETPSPSISRGTKAIREEHDLLQSTRHLGEIVRGVERLINTARDRLIAETPIDPKKTEEFRNAAQTALFDQPLLVPFFGYVQATPSNQSDDSTWLNFNLNGVSKAQLITPPMEPSGANLLEAFSQYTREAAEGLVWKDFCARTRTKLRVQARIVDESFWIALRPFALQAGSNPSMIVSRAEEEALTIVKYRQHQHEAGIEIQQRSVGERGAPYVGTISGVDIFSASFLPTGTAWLFSIDDLRLLQYVETSAETRYIDVEYVPQDQLRGALQAKFRQRATWSNAPIFEVKLLASQLHWMDG